MNIKYSEVIYYTTPDMKWGEDWEILKHMGVPFVTIESAIKYVRHNYKFRPAFNHIGLATFEQMEKGNAEWDNF
jgi:hypothetical protein